MPASDSRRWVVWGGEGVLSAAWSFAISKTPIRVGGGGFIPAKDRFIPAKDRFIPAKDCFIPARDCFIPAKDCFIPARDCFIPARDCFIPARDCFIPARDCFIPLKDRFTPLNACFAPLKKRFTPRSGRFTSRSRPFLRARNGSLLEADRLLHGMLGVSRVGRGRRRRPKLTDSREAQWWVSQRRLNPPYLL